MYEKGAKLSQVDNSVKNDLPDLPPGPAVFPVGPFFFAPRPGLAGRSRRGWVRGTQAIKPVVAVNPIEE